MNANHHVCYTAMLLKYNHSEGIFLKCFFTEVEIKFYTWLKYSLNLDYTLSKHVLISPDMGYPLTKHGLNII